MTGIVVALVLAVLGGYLIAHPPWSIPGAAVLVIASIAVSVSIVWTRRKSWAEPWPPDVTPSIAKRLRGAKRRMILSAVLLTTFVALTVVGIAERYGEQLFLAVFLTLSSALQVWLNWATIQTLEQQAQRESQPS